jgi:hypothetical protein
LLITIDTEGDHLWSRPREITTRNAAFLPRFQQLCERYGLKPTWLTNYEMACCAEFVEFGRDVLRREAGEVGMHLHAWNSPPLVPLTDDDFVRQPFLIEYPPAVMRDKIARLTDLLQSTFGCPMVSHRAGRWGLDSAYARMLIDAGYRVDCSVTPFVCWPQINWTAAGHRGCDFSQFPTGPYFLDPDRIDQAGDSPLLELPMTVRPRRRNVLASLAASAARRFGPRPVRRVANYLLPAVAWLRPDGRNLRQMLGLLRQVEAEHAPYAQFMLHSSELMPGGSPRFPTARHIERLYEDLESLFDSASQAFRGCTLAEFQERFPDRPVNPGERYGVSPPVSWTSANGAA